MAAAADPVLTRFRAALDKTCGERIERVVLFGSRARGDARPDSDYDVLVFLKNFAVTGRHEEMARISKIIELKYPDKPDVTTSNITLPYVLVEQIAYQSGAPWPAGSYTARTPLMHEVRREGVDL